MNRKYRVCHRPSSAVPSYYIHEVFFDEEGRIIFYTQQPIIPFGDVSEELYEEMCGMMDAFNDEPLNLDHVDYLIQVKRNVNE